MNKTTAIINGNEYVFQQVYNEYHEKLYFFILKQTRSEYLAEEVVQISFIKLWQYRNSLKTNLSISLQLFRIAKTTLIDLIRKQNNATALIKELKKDEDWEHSGVNAKMDVSELNRQLSGIINKMPPLRRKVFEMSRMDGLSHKEIASELSISAKTVEKHISQALKQIRSGLGWLIIIWQTIIFYLK